MELPNWYGQRDSRWASEKLGFSTQDTIGNYGCLITDLAIMCDSFCWPNNQATPHDINEWLKGNGGYVSDDLVVWGKVPSIFGAIADGTTSSEPDLANYLSQGNCVAVCGVQIYGSAHFVLAYKSVGGVVWVHDPWFNEQRPLSSYGTTFSIAHLYHKFVAPSAPAPVVPVVEPQPVSAPVPETPKSEPDVAPEPVPAVEPPVAVQTPTADIKTQPAASTQALGGFWAALIKIIIDFINKLKKGQR
jgi:hypothetical protein